MNHACIFPIVPYWFKKESFSKLKDLAKTFGTVSFIDCIFNYIHQEFRKNKNCIIGEYSISIHVHSYSLVKFLTNNRVDNLVMLSVRELPEMSGIARTKLKPLFVLRKKSKIKPISPIKSLVFRKNHVISIAFDIIFFSHVFSSSHLLVI